MAEHFPVSSDGDFDPAWRSTGIGYENVDKGAEIPRALCSGTTVRRVGDG